MAKGYSTKMNFKKQVKSIQTAGYNAARSVTKIVERTLICHLKGYPIPLLPYLLSCLEVDK